MHIPKAICETCDMEFVIAKNGVIVEMLMADGSPYYKAVGDRWQCPSCKISIVTGLAPIAEHWEPSYDNHKADVHAHFAGELRKGE